MSKARLWVLDSVQTAYMPMCARWGIMKCMLLNWVFNNFAPEEWLTMSVPTFEAIASRVGIYFRTVLYGITGGTYASVVPNAHNKNSTSGVCTSSCTNENPIKSRAFNPSTPSSGSM